MKIDDSKFKRLDVKARFIEALLAEATAKIQEMRAEIDDAIENPRETKAQSPQPMRDRIKAAKAVDEIYLMAKQAGWNK